MSKSQAEEIQVREPDRDSFIVPRFHRIQRRVKAAQTAQEIWEMLDNFKLSSP